MKQYKDTIKNNKKNKGITLIALVVTVIVLIILAAISINTLSGDNGILKKAGHAKEVSEIAEEREIVEISVLQAMGKNKNGNIEESILQSALDDNSNERAKIVDHDAESFVVKFQDSNRYYDVASNGEVSWIEADGNEKYLTVQCVNSQNTVLKEERYLVLKNTYSKKAPKVDDYVIAQDEVLTGEITENKTIQVLYYLILNDDTELVFTGLDSSGNITTDESQIASYMVGDGTTTYGNGLKVEAKSIKSVLYIPEKYNEKKVVKIGQNAFRQINTLIKTIIPDSVGTIATWSFSKTPIESLVIGKDVHTVESNAFYLCDNLKSILIKSNKLTSGFYFFNNKMLTEIRIEGNEDKYKVEDNILYSADGKTLIWCPSARTENFIVPSTVQRINERAFDSTKITRIEVPNNVTEIGDWSFNNASSIESIVIGENITNIGNNAFRNCNKLLTVIINSPIISNGITSKTSYGMVIGNATTVYIKNNITSIGSYITSNYTETTSDKPGYVKYVKN